MKPTRQVPFKPNETLRLLWLLLLQGTQDEVQVDGSITDKNTVKRRWQDREPSNVKTAAHGRGVYIR